MIEPRLEVGLLVLKLSLLAIEDIEVGAMTIEERLLGVDTALAMGKRFSAGGRLKEERLERDEKEFFLVFEVVRVVCKAAVKFELVGWIIEPRLLRTMTLGISPRFSSTAELSTLGIVVCKSGAA